MHQCSFWSNILCNAFGHHVGAARLVPFSANLETGQITCPGARFGFNLARHNLKLLSVLPSLALSKTQDQQNQKLHSSSALSFSRTEKSSNVVTSPATDPLVAISRNSRRMIFPDRVLGSASVNLISSGRARAPISLATWARSS